MSSREAAFSPDLLGAQAEDDLNGSGFLGSADVGRERKKECDEELKELLLVNLDLIQNQQELLLANEKTILALRKENEMLKCRLDRIERRMSLVYHKEFHPCSSLPSTAGSPHHHGDGRPTRSSHRKLNLEATEMGKNESPEKGDVISNSDAERGRKRKLPDETPEAAESRTQLTPRKLITKSSAVKSKTSRRSDMPKSTSEDETIQKQQPTDDDRKEEKTDQKQERLRKRIRKDSELLMTETLYYVPPLSVSMEEEEEEEAEGKLNEEQILVPSWRTKHLSSLYVMEGTENLDDRVFLKRHQKSEAEEKRRKRWDIQRLKDLQLLRRQQMKEEASSFFQQEVLTFRPHIDRALYVEVNDKIPVSAFGYPIPTVEKREFQLPWYNVYKDETTKNKKTRNKQL